MIAAVIISFILGFACCWALSPIEIVVKLYNHGSNDLFMYDGEKISQLVVIPVIYEDIEIVDQITGGPRGDNGFGSTGV